MNKHFLQTKKTYIILSLCGLTLLNLIIVMLFFSKNEIADTNTTLQSASSQGSSLGNSHIYNKNMNKNDYVIQEMKACQATGGAHDCYKTLANNLSSSFSLKDSLAILAENEKVPEVYYRCHEVTHYLGRDDYQTTKSISTSFSSCNSTCQGGCYHGVTEEYLHEKNLSIKSSAFETTIREMCGKSTDYSRSYIYFECLHGTGHAAMFVTDNNLLQSLHICDFLNNTPYSETCYGGVFMENSSSSTTNGHPSLFIKSDDPLFPCNSLNLQYQQICYRYQSSYFSIISHNDWGKTSQLCLKVPLIYQKDCFSTIGSGQVGFTQDKNIMNENCMKVPTQYQQICIESVIASMATRFVDKTNYLKDFCSVVSKNYQAACFEKIALATYSLNQGKENIDFINQ